MGLRFLSNQNYRVNYKSESSGSAARGCSQLPAEIRRGIFKIVSKSASGRLLWPDQSFFVRANF
jgi:hypothetical protein